MASFNTNVVTTSSSPALKQHQSSLLGKLNADVRFVLYDHMKLYPETDGNDWSGLALSCRQINDEMAHAALVKLKLRLQEIQQDLKEKKSWDIRFEIKDVKSIIVEVPAAALERLDINALNPLLSLYLDRITFLIKDEPEQAFKLSGEALDWITEQIHGIGRAHHKLFWQKLTKFYAVLEPVRTSAIVIAWDTRSLPSDPNGGLLKQGGCHLRGYHGQNACDKNSETSKHLRGWPSNYQAPIRWDVFNEVKTVGETGLRSFDRWQYLDGQDVRLLKVGSSPKRAESCGIGQEIKKIGSH